MFYLVWCPRNNILITTFRRSQEKFDCWFRINKFSSFMVSCAFCWMDFHPTRVQKRIQPRKMQWKDCQWKNNRYNKLQAILMICIIFVKFSILLILKVAQFCNLFIQKHTTNVLVPHSSLNFKKILIHSEIAAFPT